MDADFTLPLCIKITLIIQALAILVHSKDLNDRQTKICVWFPNDKMT
jgi:hypothetical protein